MLTCFSQTPGIQKWWKLTSFGVDMFFSNSWNPKNGENGLVLVLIYFFLKLLESKKWWKLTSFGVDMFFSNSCKSKNGENWLVLVLIYFFFQIFGLDMFFSNSCKSKNWENWLILVLTDWNLEPRSPKYRKIMTGDSKLLPKPPEMGQVLSSG